jgi:hypothetical protein
VSRQDQYNVTVTVDGTDLGTFDKLTGGEIDSEETTYKVGGMGPRISLGGSVNPGNVTVQVLYDLARIHTMVHWLIGRVGKGNATISKQPLDIDGNVYGRAITYPAKLKQVNPPEVDSESSDAALLELEFTVNGSVV